LAAQNPVPSEAQAPPPDIVIRINVNLVQIDAVVTDKAGKPVTGLKADDFQILQDNKPQKITNFAFISTKAAAARAPVRPPADAKRPGAAPPPPPTALKPSQIRRTIALVVDDLGLSFESIVRVRQSLKKFVDKEMQPGDLVAIIRTGAGMGALQQFSSDPRVLYAAIDRVKFNAIGRVSVSSFAPLGSGGGTGSAMADDRRNEIFSVGSLGAIRYVVDGLRELPGRKSVILFSENLKLFYAADGMSQEVLDEVHHLTDAANRASVVIHSIDPRGLQTLSLTAADNTRGMTAQQISEVPIERATEEFNSRDGMVMLAHDTGGLFKYNTNDIDGALREVVADGDGYYLIGYHPAASTFDAKTGEFRFHSMKVRVNRPGVTVRTRQGFYGESDRQARPSVPQTRQGELLHALTSPFGSSDIHVRLTPLFTDAPKLGSYVTGMLHIEGKDLTFTDEPEGVHKAVIDVLAATFGDNGQIVDSSDRTYTITVKEGAYQDLMKNGLLYNFHHPVKKPGAYQVRIALRDATTGKVGSASQFLEVPDVSKGHLTLSTMLMKSMPPETPAAADRAPSAAEEGQVHDADPQGSPAIRIFKPGAAILYAYQVLNAQEGPGQRPELEAHTRLYRDGTQVYEGKPMALSSGIQADPRHLAEGGSFKLGAAMVPGDYVLQVIVNDKLAKDKYNTASQWIDFEVR